MSDDQVRDDGAVVHQVPGRPVDGESKVAARNAKRSKGERLQLEKRLQNYRNILADFEEKVAATQKTIATIEKNMADLA